MATNRKYRINEYLQLIGLRYGRETKAFVIQRICERLKISKYSLQSWRYATIEDNAYRGTNLSQERLKVIAEEINEYLPKSEHITTAALQNTVIV